MQHPQRTPYSGASLVRVLARLTQTGVPASDVSLPDRLSQWLGWTDAIALSSALDAAAPAPITAAQTARGDATAAALEAALCARTRATLTEAINASRPGAKARRGGASTSGRGVATRNRVEARIEAGVEARIEAGVEAHAATFDFAPFGQRYQAQQQSMENAIGELRGRLRAMLATRGERHARLALVDATMARALDPRERNLLATVPTLLEAHFTRLRDTAIAAAEAATQAQRDEEADEAANETAKDAANKAATEAATEAANEAPTKAAPRDKNTLPAPPATAWLDAFQEDMHAVLLAELDVRFQPVEGLLAALRAS